MDYQCNHSGQINLLLQITSQYFSVHIENELKVALGAIIQIHLGPLNHMFPVFFIICYCVFKYTSILKGNQMVVCFSVQDFQAEQKRELGVPLSSGETDSPSEVIIIDI